MNRQLTLSNNRKTPEGIHDTIARLSVLRDARSEMLRQQSTAPTAPEHFSSFALNS
jgi:hypothetical protein